MSKLEAKGQRWRFAARLTGRVALWCALVATLAWGVRAGLRWRDQTWEISSSAHADWDMYNGWSWGRRAATEGYVNLYDRVRAEHPDANYGLDYVPLRLGVMTGWATWNRAHNADSPVWRVETSFNRPWMWFNTSSDALAAVAAGGLVFSVCRRAFWPRMRSAVYALLAALLLWLNPAVLVSGYGRPTWDVWMLPWFLLASWAAVKRHWTTAGVMLAIGVMFKGQQTGALPFFVPFVIAMAGPRALLRFAAGLGAMTVAILSPWLFTLVPRGNESRPWNSEAFVAVAFGVVIMILLAIAGWGAIQFWTARRARASAPLWIARRKVSLRGLLTATLLGITLGAAWPICRGQASTAWWDVAFVYGANKYPALESGGTASLGGLLANSFGWRSEDLFYHQYTIKQALVALYSLSAITCGVAAGIQWRRRDIRMLVAFPAVWVCFFAFMPLMHERYLLWGAAYCGIAMPVTWGIAPLGIFLSAASYLMTLRIMIGLPARLKYHALGYNGNQWAAWGNAILPGAAWGVIVAACVLWWLSVSTLGRRPNPPAPR